MKEILIKNGGEYRTVPASALKLDSDNTFHVGGIAIESNARSNTSFCNVDSKIVNYEMLSKLIKLIYEKFICNTIISYNYCLIDENDMTVLFKYPTHASLRDAVKYGLVDNNWKEIKE